MVGRNPLSKRNQLSKFKIKKAKNGIYKVYRNGKLLEEMYTLKGAQKIVRNETNYQRVKRKTLVYDYDASIKKSGKSLRHTVRVKKPKTKIVQY